ncbi:MAG: ribbon-helix-helix protein, CopG family [Micavibrio sp.]|nr:ribbon-helix-helix protein, CopG family [Micavibrio sp.]
MEKKKEKKQPGRKSFVADIIRVGVTAEMKKKIDKAQKAAGIPSAADFVRRALDEYLK